MHILVILPIHDDTVRRRAVDPLDGPRSDDGTTVALCGPNEQALLINAVGGPKPIATQPTILPDRPLGELDHGVDGGLIIDGSGIHELVRLLPEGMALGPPLRQHAASRNE